MLKEISAAALRPYLVTVRGERNTARSHLANALRRIERLERELSDARDACRRYREAETMTTSEATP